jgi:hypothetical protein
VTIIGCATAAPSVRLLRFFQDLNGQCAFDEVNADS